MCLFLSFLLQFHPPFCPQRLQMLKKLLLLTVSVSWTCSTSTSVRKPSRPSCMSLVPYPSTGCRPGFRPRRNLRPSANGQNRPKTSWVGSYNQVQRVALGFAFWRPLRKDPFCYPPQLHLARGEDLLEGSVAAHHFDEHRRLGTQACLGRVG